MVWDFDWSLVNQNSDTFIIHEMDGTGEIWPEGQRRMADGEGWTALMDWAAGELHGRHGVTPAQIRQILQTIPIMPKVHQAVELAARWGAEQNILSDANSVYISTCLAEPLRATAHFSRVETNPAHFDAAGRLRIRPHQPASTSHGCPNCPPNLCKGAVLQLWFDERPSRRCLYVGDGKGDFCPASRMRRGDVLFARRAPHDCLLSMARASDGVVAQIIEWGGEDDPDGAELLAGFEASLLSCKPH